jgi:hypothetical protein
MAQLVTLMIASRGCSMRGSVTVSPPDVFLAVPDLRYRSSPEARQPPKRLFGQG